MNDLIVKMEEEKRRIQSLDKQLEGCRSKMVNLQHTHRPANEQEDKRAIESTLRIIEKRTNQGIDKLNYIVDGNETLRKGIDELRQERVVYDGIYKKLENELCYQRQHTLLELLRLL